MPDCHDIFLRRVTWEEQNSHKHTTLIATKTQVLTHIFGQNDCRDEINIV